MATVEEVLNSVSNEKDYLHDDIQFIIDENFRTITVPDEGVVLGVVGDKDVNRVNFMMPRYYNGLDMSTFVTRIMFINARGVKSFYTVTDVTVENDHLLFTWLVGEDVAVEAGNVEFSVNMQIKDTSALKQAFNTTIATGTILDSIEAGGDDA